MTETENAIFATQRAMEIGDFATNIHFGPLKRQNFAIFLTERVYRSMDDILKNNNLVVRAKGRSFNWYEQNDKSHYNNLKLTSLCCK